MKAIRVYKSGQNLCQGIIGSYGAVLCRVVKKPNQERNFTFISCCCPFTHSADDHLRETNFTRDSIGMHSIKIKNF
jgi:hypothetical protein